MAYEGTIFDRLYGINHFVKYTNSENKTVLDIGCSAGLVAYEFARAGAKLIHGIDLLIDEVTLANDIMYHTGIEYDFHAIDLRQGPAEIERMFEKNEYDVVLFLGMYHHLVKQLSFDQLFELINWIMLRTKKYLLVRTGDFKEIENVIKPTFRMTNRYLPFKKIGEMRVYERCSE